MKPRVALILSLCLLPFAASSISNFSMPVGYQHFLSVGYSAHCGHSAWVAFR
jgi:hypothetical protein